MNEAVYVLIFVCFLPRAAKMNWPKAPYEDPQAGALIYGKTPQLTTASDELGPNSIALLQAPLVSIHDPNQIKRENALRELVEIDFGANISHVLSYIRTKRGYDKRIRPNYKGRPIKVAVNMFICAVSQLSEVNMDVTIDFYFRQFWQDSRLDFTAVWSEELVIGGEFMREIWRPDSFFVNAKQSSFHQVTTMNTFVRILPSGNVTQSLRLTVTASCPMNFTYFPMDSQRCSLVIESFGYTTRDIIFTWANKASVGFASEAFKLPQFRIRGHRELSLIVNKEAKLHFDGNFSRLVLDIYFDRSLGYYVIQIYVPAILIVVLSQVAFWVDRRQEPARIALGITTVLTMTTLISSTNANMAKISYLKAIDIYLFSCFITVFSSLLEYAAVSYSDKRCRMRQRRSEDLLPGSDEVFATQYERSEQPSFCPCCQIANVRASNIEKYARGVIPTIFISFNVIYWITYLNISACSLNEEGLIAVK